MDEGLIQQKEDIEPDAYSRKIRTMDLVINEVRRFIKNYVDNVPIVLDGLNIPNIETSLKATQIVINEIDFDLKKYNKKRLNIFKANNENIQMFIQDTIQKLNSKEVRLEYETLYKEMAGITTPRIRTITTPLTKKPRITYGGSKKKDTAKSKKT
jgi:uncharacterized membrane-anchored protein